MLLTPFRGVLCLAVLLSQPVLASDLPNIVVFYADDLGYGDVAIQNPQSKIPTPNLDRLARQGTRFTDAHSSSGICTPSRYALLHGRYHWRKFHGIVNSFDPSVMDDERTTLAELLRSRGYRTACIGKWHLGWDWDSIKHPGAEPQGPENARAYAHDAFDWSLPIAGGPLDHGFDYYFGDDVPNFPPYTWFENDRVLTPPTTTLRTTRETAEGNWEARPGPAVEDWDFWGVMPKRTERAVEWVESQSGDEPFFLYFPFTSPHAPIVPSEAFLGKSQAGGYGDFVVQTDDTVGQVVAALERCGFSDNTLIIFSSDNGPEHYAYPRLQRFEHRSMGRLRGLKRDIWEGGHRVPLIIQWPGRIPAGHVKEGLISQIDLYATFANIVQAEVPEGSAEDSLDQSTFMLGNGESVRTVLVHNTNPNHYALRQGDWVYVEGASGAITRVPQWFDQQHGYVANDLPFQLYNLRSDLEQKHNVASIEKERVSQMQALLREIVPSKP